MPNSAKCYIKFIKQLYLNLSETLLMFPILVSAPLVDGHLDDVCTVGRGMDQPARSFRSFTTAYDSGVFYGVFNSQSLVTPTPPPHTPKKNPKLLMIISMRFFYRY